MNKLWLIIRREYITRVQKKSFILATILTPLGIGLLMVVSGYFASSSMSSAKKIVVVDSSKIINPSDLEGGQFEYTFSDKSISELEETYTKDGYDFLVEVPPLTDLKTIKHKINFYSSEKPGLTTIERMERNFSKALKEYKIKQSDVDKKMLEELDIKVMLENANAGAKEGGGSGDGSSRMSIVISSALSYIMGFLMYIVIFVYGGMVMRSVMEEKINRIVEVMISSVKPFQLMLGKVIGVGLVGLTQLVIWMILIPIILYVVSSIFGVDPNAGASAGQTAEVLQQVQASSDDFNINQLINEIKALNWLLILPSFILFFLGGYFIYSSLFAAVGSAIGDDLGEGQQLMMPIIIPVIIAFVMVPAVFNDPDGKVAIFGSMFPLFSPILMPARLPFNPPIWQVILSILILAASVVFMIWLAARIYRVGILMYGKKVSFKEIGKWMWM